jgi:hypothetical protein
MIDKYVGGKLPTLDRIDYQNAKPGMMDKINSASAWCPRSRSCSSRIPN